MFQQLYTGSLQDILAQHKCLIPILAVKSEMYFPEIDELMPDATFASLYLHHCIEQPCTINSDQSIYPLHQQ